MQVNHFKLLIAIILIAIDFYLQKHLRKEGKIFLEINKYKFRFILVGILLILLIYLIVNKEYLLCICCLSLLRIIDKLIYVYKNNKF